MKIMKQLAYWGAITSVCVAALTAVSITSAEVQNETKLIERHLIQMEGSRNFRDLGGYQTKDGKTVKPGLLYRSGVLHHLTDNDYQRIRDLEISTVVDFRANDERESEPTEWKAGPAHIMTWNYEMEMTAEDGQMAQFMNPELDEATAEALMAEMYRGMIFEQQEHYRDMFDVLVETDRPLLFHCSAGKDRTGIAAALILHALGVDQETIIADYTLTEAIYTNPAYTNDAPSLNDIDTSDEQYAFMQSMPEPALNALMGARASYIETAFDEMRKEFGSVDAYLRDGLGLSDADIASLKMRLLK